MALYAAEVNFTSNPIILDTSTIAGWTPLSTDQVVVSLGGDSVSDANIPIRVVWDTNHWKVYSDDTSGVYTGKIQVIIRVLPV